MSRSWLFSGPPGWRRDQNATRPGHDSDSTGNYRELVDVVATAFACGASRVAVLGVHEPEHVSFGGDWHQDVGHQHRLDGPQAVLAKANQAVF